MTRIVVLPGDGIGPEVAAEAVKCLKLLSVHQGLDFTFEDHDFGGVAIDNHGHPLPDSTLAACREADAILMGAVGGRRGSSPAADGRDCRWRCRRNHDPRRRSRAPDGRKAASGISPLRRPLRDRCRRPAGPQSSSFKKLPRADSCAVLRRFPTCQAAFVSGWLASQAICCRRRAPTFSIGCSRSAFILAA